jgi:hypothetical protein
MVLDKYKRVWGVGTRVKNWASGTGYGDAGGLFSVHPQLARLQFRRRPITARRFERIPVDCCCRDPFEPGGVEPVVNEYEMVSVS